MLSFRWLMVCLGTILLLHATELALAQNPPTSKGQDQKQANRHAEIERRTELTLQQDRLRLVRYGLGLVVSISFVIWASWYIYKHPPVFQQTSVRGVLLAACGAVPRLTLWFVGLFDAFEINYGIRPSGPDLLARALTLDTIYTSVWVYVVLMNIGILVTMADKGYYKLQAIIVCLAVSSLAMIPLYLNESYYQIVESLLAIGASLGLLFAIVIPGNPFAAEPESEALLPLDHDLPRMG